LPEPEQTPRGMVFPTHDNKIPEIINECKGLMHQQLKEIDVIVDELTSICNSRTDISSWCNQMELE